MKYRFLEDCCDILDNQRVPVKGIDRQYGDYPYYGANGLQGYIDDYIFDDELVLLAEDGGSFGSKEKAIAYRVSGKCWVNNHAHVLKPHQDIDVDFLCYALMFYPVDALVNGSTRQKLTQSAMRKMKIPAYDLNKQKYISEQLKILDKLIAKYEKYLSLVDNIVKSRFVELFGDPVTNPMKWKVKSLSELGDCKNGMNFHKGESGIDIHCLGVGDFQNLSVITDTSVLPIVSLNENPSEEYMLQDGDIVFVRSNGNKNLVGRCLTIYPHDIPTTFSGFCIRYRISNKDKVLTEYLLQVLKHEAMRQKITGRGANIQNLNQQILSALQIPLPPIDLQRQFIEFVELADKSKLAVQQSIETLQTLKAKLMQDYFG